MVQRFRAVRCVECATFQVQYCGKSKKWSCKVCGQKQSVLKVFTEGSAKECRAAVQALSMAQANIAPGSTAPSNGWDECDTATVGSRDKHSNGSGEGGADTILRQYDNAELGGPNYGCEAENYQTAANGKCGSIQECSEYRYDPASSIEQDVSALQASKKVKEWPPTGVAKWELFVNESTEDDEDTRALDYSNERVIIDVAELDARDHRRKRAQKAGSDRPYKQKRPARQDRPQSTEFGSESASPTAKVGLLASRSAIKDVSNTTATSGGSAQASFMHGRQPVLESLSTDAKIMAPTTEELMDLASPAVNPNPRQSTTSSSKWDAFV